jgi:hypothetical protein
MPAIVTGALSLARNTKKEGSCLNCRRLQSYVLAQGDDPDRSQALDLAETHCQRSA